VLKVFSAKASVLYIFLKFRNSSYLLFSKTLFYFIDCGLSIHSNCVKSVLGESCEPKVSDLASLWGTELGILVKASGGDRPPSVLTQCITHIEARGLHTEGIYRISGSREGTERLKNLFERGKVLYSVSEHLFEHICKL
jgi:hypothetical protein